jgi:hypothetical protein
MNLRAISYDMDDNLRGGIGIIEGEAHTQGLVEQDGPE